MDFLSESEGLTVWYGQGNGNFTPIRVNREGSGHLILDLESDGDPDVIPFFKFWQ